MMNFTIKFRTIVLSIIALGKIIFIVYYCYDFNMEIGTKNKRKVYSI